MLKNHIYVYDWVSGRTTSNGPGSVVVDIIRILLPVTYTHTYKERTIFPIIIDSVYS